MDHFAGMDVSVKETSVCILDDAGKILQEVKVASEPQALLKVLGNPAYCFKRIGLEAGPCCDKITEVKLPPRLVDHRRRGIVPPVGEKYYIDERGTPERPNAMFYGPDPTCCSLEPSTLPRQFP